LLTPEEGGRPDIYARMKGRWLADGLKTSRVDEAKDLAKCIGKSAKNRGARRRSRDAMKWGC
jgi:hypothetical protein